MTNSEEAIHDAIIARYRRRKNGRAPFVVDGVSDALGYPISSDDVSSRPGPIPQSYVLTIRTRGSVYNVGIVMEELEP